MDLEQTLRELTSVPGPSGFESAIGTVIEHRFRELGFTVRRDRLGNVIARMNGEGPEPRPFVMVAAHMDEIGLMVTHLEGGFARVQAIGGVDAKTLLGQELLLCGTEPLTAVVAAKPPHLQTAEERERSVALDELYLDFGLSEEEVQNRVRPGDVAVVKREYIALMNRRGASRAMDNRASVAAMLVCAEEWRTLRPAPDLLLVATVKEEVGGIGALTGAAALRPDVGIAVDVCHGNFPGAASDLVAEMGKGPAIGRGPNIHRKVWDLLEDTAVRERIPYQTEWSQGNTYTDAWEMQIAGTGVATGLVSIPLRYMHTSVEVVALEDIEMVGRLLARALSRVDAEFREGLSCC